MMRHKLEIAFALTGLLLLLAACSPAPQPQAPAAPPPATEPQAAAEPPTAIQRPSAAAPQVLPGASVLEGVTWQGLSADGAPHGATIRFEAGQVHGFGGCNRFVGSYALENGRLRIESLAGTMMACEPAVMVGESAFLAALSGTHDAVVDAGRLTLVAVGADAPPMVFEAAPAPGLDGVNWEVTGFNNGRQAVVGPLDGTTLQLAFDEQAIFGHAGCNRFRALYALDGNTIRVEPPAATRMFCDGEGVMEQEAQFLAALASATAWSIERGMLDMHRADGERVLIAREAE
jgi:heat shock protein HslJ